MSNPTADFDRFLDDLAANRRPVDRPGDAGMHAAAEWLASSTPRPNPSASFARTLRASLMSTGESTPSAGHPLASGRRQHVSGPVRLRRGWIFAEAATLLLLLLPAIWFLTRTDSPGDPPAGGSGHSISAPGLSVSNATSPTVTAVKHDTLFPTPGMGTATWGGYTPTAFPTRVVPVAPALTEGAIVETTFDTALRVAPGWTEIELQTLPGGTLLYVRDQTHFVPGGATWLPVIEPVSKQEGWVLSAWTQSPVIGDRIITEGALAQTTNTKNLYQNLYPQQNLFSEPIATFESDHLLFVIQTPFENAGTYWLEVIDPGSQQIGWMMPNDIEYVEFPNPIASPAPFSGDVATIVPSPEFAVGSVVRADDDVPLLANGSIGSAAVGRVQRGQQLLVIGDEIVVGEYRWTAVQVVPAGRAAWIPTENIEFVDPAEFTYPVETTVVARVEIEAWERLPSADQVTTAWRRPAGTVLTIAGAPERFDEITMLPVIDPANGIGGWVWSDLLARPEENNLPPVATGVLVSSSIELYLRESYDPSSAVVATINVDEPLRVSHQWKSPEGELWLAVERNSDGMVGWITAETVRESVIAASLAPSVGQPLTLRYESEQFAAGAIVVYTGRAKIEGNSLVLLVRDEADGIEGWLSSAVLEDDVASLATATPGSARSPEVSTSTDYVTALGIPATLDSLVVKIGSRATPIYEQASTGSLVIASAEAGAIYEIVGEILETDRQVWIQVLIPETGEFGWIDAGMPSSRPYLMPVSIETRATAYLRKSPSFGDNLIRILQPGAAFKPFGASVIQGGLTWVTVLDQSTGQIGWIAAALGSPLLWPVGTTVEVLVDLNFRGSPTFDGQVIRALPKGTALIVVGDAVETDTEIWIKVRDENGETGYVVASDETFRNR